MRFTCVLRSGGDFTPEHVATLARGIQGHHPGAEIHCLTDMPLDCKGVTALPLKHNWPGWWSKMELFRPDLAGDCLYMDLDTTIVGDLSDIASVDCLTVPADFYWPGTRKIQSSFMFIPDRCRNQIWKAWTENPKRHMRECVTRHRWGDQGFLQRYWKDAQRWQEVLPGQVISYKCHVRRRKSAREFGTGYLPENARVVCFHGKPRPWDKEVILI